LARLWLRGTLDRQRDHDGVELERRDERLGESRDDVRNRIAAVWLRSLCCQSLITTHYACLAYMKRPSFLPAPLLGFVSLAVTGIFSYRQLDELEKEAKLKLDESNDFYDNMIKKLLYEDEKKA
jgi:hypothetical protein